MAAPSNKPSPTAADASNASNKPENEAPTRTEAAATETAAAPTSSPPVIKLKDPPPAAAAAASAAGMTATASPPQLQEEPTYQSSQESTEYAAAKALLNQGAFEDALTHAEQGIANTRHTLASLNNKTEDELTFHPALAPFHYLYGTTLLYAVEESSDTMGLTNANTNTNQGEQGGPAAADEDDVEDIQIAWETLDLARTILERMMSSSSSNNNSKESPQNNYALDLAQIYLRQGDLHKMNGRYGPAVADYQASLKYRTQVLPCPFNRKIADAHYNLALSHMMLIAEQQQQAPTDAADDTNTPLMSPAALKEHHERSIHHYLECARTFCGILAILCQQDPHEFFQKLDNETDTANLKTTGEEEQDNNSSSNNNLDSDASRQLTKLRQHVQRNLQPPSADDDLEAKAEFEEICQLLAEIQETIDEAENSVKGVHQIAEMKAEISAAASASVDDDTNKNEGQQAAASNAFGSTAATASTAVAQTIMAVKKKPKKRPPATEAQEEVTKRPKSAE